MFRTSLQTITWGDPQHHLFDEIFALAAASGFSGVEIGFRRLGQVSIGEARRLFNRHGLALSACHVGGNLADLAQAADERAAIHKVLDYLEGLGGAFLIYSGLNQDNDSDLDEELDRMHTLAQECSLRGVRMLYHNHDWEFRNDQRIWLRLRGAAIEGLGFAPDLGWAVKGGRGMRGLLDEIGDDVAVLHFKDFLSWDDGQNTCHLGSGVVDFRPAWDWLAMRGPQNIWITAEQDNAEDNAAAASANSEYLRSQLSRLAR